MRITQLENIITSNCVTSEILFRGRGKRIASMYVYLLPAPYKSHSVAVNREILFHRFIRITWIIHHFLLSAWSQSNKIVPLHEELATTYDIIKDKFLGLSFFLSTLFIIHFTSLKFFVKDCLLLLSSTYKIMLSPTDGKTMHVP